MAGNVLRPPSTIPPRRTESPGGASARAALPRRARRSTRTGSPPQRRSRPSPASSTRAAASRRGRPESRDRRSGRRAGHRARSSSPSGAARTAPAPWRPAGRAGTSASGVSAGPTRKIAANSPARRRQAASTAPNAEDRERLVVADEVERALRVRRPDRLVEPLVGDDAESLAAGPSAVGTRQPPPPGERLAGAISAPARGSATVT